jgi:hypothetical protein
MTTIYKVEADAPLLSIESLQPIEERVAVSSVVEVSVINRDALTLTTQHLLAGAESAKEKGPLQIDTEHDAVRQQLKITLAGSLPAVRNLLNYKYATNKRLFDERAEIASIGLRRRCLA